MLIINGKVLDLSNPKTESEVRVKKEMEELAEKLGLKEKGKTVVIVYPKEHIYPNKENPLKPHKPNSIKIQYRISVPTSVGREEWIYAQGIKRDNRDQLITTPNGRNFNGTLILSINDIDLIYFLSIHPKMKGSENATGIPYMQFEDAVSDAKAYAAQVSAKAKAALIFSEEHLSDSKLREFGTAIGMTNIKNEDSHVLRKLMYNIVVLDKKKIEALSDFLDSSKKTQSSVEINPEIEESVQAAIADGKFNLVGDWWMHGEMQIAKVNKNQKAEEVLIKYFNKNSAILDKFLKEE